MPAPQLVIQTTYAELLERCSAADFDWSFSEAGSFVAKVIKDRRYWYFQTSTTGGRTQRYVGPETPELLERIEKHQRSREDERERRALVATLVRSFGLPAPLSQMGKVLAGLSAAGVFRLRAVLVGTLAYQTYPAMLGTRLSSSLLQTSDIDVAQFTSVSMAMGDKTAPMLEILKSVDRSFREVPASSADTGTASYVAKGSLRVDFLTPNEGPDTDDPQALPALQTAAQPLRFLDFLIYDAVPAVLLHGPGILVRVPPPERFAIHKLILARRRPAAVAKSDKDILQAAALLDVLAAKQPDGLRSAWEEAYGRGPTWRRLLLAGMAQLPLAALDATLKAIRRPRSTIPGMDLTFDSPPIRYDSMRDVVMFNADCSGATVRCAVSRETLEDHFGANNTTIEGRLEAARKHRSTIERLLRVKFLSKPVEDPEAVLLKPLEIEELNKLTASAPWC